MRLEPVAAADNVFECFAYHAATSPESVAVIDEAGATSYGLLAARADAIARYLLAQGLEPEQPVGVFMQRRTELLAVLLGVWKAGGAYVPCDPEDPVDRVRRMLASCDGTFVIGDPPLLQALRTEYKDSGITPPRMIDPATIPDGPIDTTPLKCAEGGERLAYLLFTSGSTGEPKAVEIEHRQVKVLLESARDLLGFGPGDRYLAAATIAFDASITELFLPLVTGGSLLLRDRGILLDSKRLVRDLRDFGVTVMATSPSVWAVLLAAEPDFPRLRVLITHSEAVTPDLARRLCAYCAEAWNLYGPTETTVWATGWRLAADMDAGLSSTSAPIGWPLRHVRAMVVDDHGVPVADGVEGELCLGGPSVARGYRGNEILTRERFIEIDGERAYRSGDVVVRDAQGVLHYFGRNDDQMKVRGVRVEPSEVETAILRDPRVVQTAATWFPTLGGSRAIVAAVVLQPGVVCRPQDLHDALVDCLPGPMIPARFVFVPELPMTVSGKIDRLAIRQAATRGVDGPLNPTGAEPRAVPLRALSKTEIAIAAVWRRLLGLETVAPDDHFFSIGGDSLTAVQMIVEVEGIFDLVLPIHLAFEAPTVETLSLRIDRIREQLDEQLSNEFVFPLVKGGDRAPIFFSGADLALARRGVWTLPCPVYSITNWAKGSGFVSTKSMEVLAAEHLDGVRRIQPHGPYRLAGFSFGGLIAFEMAHQLRDAGEEVEFLFLLDPMAPRHVAEPGHGAAPDENRGSLGHRIKGRLQLIAQGPGTDGLGQWLSLFVPIAPATMVGWYRYTMVDYYLRYPNPLTRMLFPRSRWRAFWFAARRMVKGYAGRRYDGPVLAVFCEDGARREVWRSLLGSQSRQCDLTAAHDVLFKEPARGQWMAWLAEYLADKR